MWRALVVRGANHDGTVDPSTYDLDRPDNVKKLYNLLKRSAESACGDSQIADMHIRTLSWLKCVSETLDAAVERVNRPALTAYHRTRSAGSEEKSPVEAAPRGSEEPKSSFVR